MGINGLDSVIGNDSREQEKAPRPSSQEMEEKRQAELAAEREEHNRRTNTGIKDL